MAVDSPSVILFTYPFLFENRYFDTVRSDTDYVDRVDLAQRIDDQRWGKTAENPVWRRLVFRRHELLRHVGDFLNPPPGSAATARAWELDGNALQSPRFLGSGSGSRWVMHCRDRTIPFRIERIQLVLFCTGVGLMVLQIRPDTCEESDWLDLIHYGRFLKGRRSMTLEIARRVSPQSESSPEWIPFFPEFAGGTAEHPDGTGELGDIVHGLLASVWSGWDEQPWWREVFLPDQMMPYVVLYISGKPSSERPAFLYRVHNFFHANQPLHIGDTELHAADGDRLPYAKDQWFLFSLDGGGFVAFDPPDTPFFRETLSDHLRNEYFVLYLLALNQRFSLMKLSEEVSRHWDEAPDGDWDSRSEVFEAIRDRLLQVIARTQFIQVAQRQHHHRCYQQWQKVFQMRELQQEVREEVQDLREHLMAKRSAAIERQTRRVEQRLNFLTFRNSLAI